MRLLYDHQIFTTQNYGGISRYFCELMYRFKNMHEINFSLALRYSNNENLLCRPQLNKYWSNKSDFFSSSQFSFIQKFFHANILYHLHINQNESIRLIKKDNYDIFHPTNFDPYFLKYLKRKPFVLTVYDMIHEKFPDYYSNRDPTTIWKTELIEKAESIIAISNNTKNDIIQYHGIDPDRISVVYLGNPFDLPEKFSFLRQLNIETMFDKNYILFVGSRTRYKNFTLFVASVSSLLQKSENQYLYCAGGGPFTASEIKALKDLNIYDKVYYFDINDNIMMNLYKNAQAFIFPSLYEGFGLPILEAFSCGCPLVTSNSSSLSEIAGDAACYIDPNDAESILRGVESILLNPNYRTELIQKGYERLKFFSWEKTARETKKVYDNIIQ